MTNLLYLLPVLACPLGMGLCMWLMMRTGRHSASATSRTAEPTPQLALNLDERAELERLRAETGAQPARNAAAEHAPSSGG